MLVVMGNSCRHADGVAARYNVLHVLLVPFAPVDQVFLSSNASRARRNTVGQAEAFLDHSVEIWQSLTLTDG